MKKYFTFFKVFLQRHLAYRARIVIWSYADIVQIIIFPFLWLAIFNGREIIAGYTPADIVTYYVVVVFISLTCRSHISERIKMDILRGVLNNYLVKPTHYIFAMTMYEFSYRFISGCFAILAIIAIKLLFPAFISIPTNLLSIIFFIISIIIASTISHAIQIIIGTSSFWLGENTGPERLRRILEEVFSGKLAPLTFFPFILQVIAVYLPFSYITYIPTQIFLEKLSVQEIFTGYAYAGIWIIVLSITATILWKKGTKIYEGVGI